SGASIGATSGAFSWTPSESHGPGDYTFTVQVSDGSLTDAETVTLHVTEGNVAPVLSDVPTSATISEETLYTFTATATDHDDPPNSLTFSLIGAPAGASLD